MVPPTLPARVMTISPGLTRRHLQQQQRLLQVAMVRAAWLAGLLAGLPYVCASRGAPTPRPQACTSRQALAGKLASAPISTHYILLPLAPPPNCRGAG